MFRFVVDIRDAGFLYTEEKRVDCLLYGIETEVCSMKISGRMLGIV